MVHYIWQSVNKKYRGFRLKLFNEYLCRTCVRRRREAYSHSLFQKAQDQQGRKRRSIIEGEFWLSAEPGQDAGRRIDFLPRMWLHDSRDAEFLLSKGKYKAATGREQRWDADVLCYQICQLFERGEIAPEEANQAGYETAMQRTKGKYALFVATHTGCQLIHIISRPFRIL